MYTYKFRIYPTKSQKVLLSKHFGCCRYLYNYFLNKRNELYKTTNKGSNYNKDAKQLTELKKELVWLKEVNAQSLQSTLKNLDSAFSSFFNKRNHFPKFKSRKHRQSFKIPQHTKIKNNKLYIPKFRTGIKTIFHREVQGRIINATISLNKSGQYFVSILTDVEPSQIKNLKLKKNKKAIALDLGIKTFITTSNNEKYQVTPAYYKYKNEIVKLQQRISKSTDIKLKSKLQKTVNKIFRKCTNIRTDFLHKLSLKLIRENQTIIIEDLNVKEILSNKFLADDMQDCPFGLFTQYLEYKSNWYNRQLVKVNKWYPSSKTCSKCGNINKDLELKDRTWDCPKCHTSHERDFNASLNLLTVGLHGLAKA